MAPISEITTDSQRTIARHLGRGHAHGPQQPELTRPLEHRQRQGVDDAEEGDQHRQQQHHGDEGEQLVDRPARPLLETGLVQHLSVRVVGQRVRDGVLHLALVRTVGQCHQAGGRELGSGEGVLLGDAEHEVVADPALAVVDGDHVQPVGAGRGELRRHRVTDRPSRVPSPRSSRP
jgi:hypothetical protein